MSTAHPPCDCGHQFEPNPSWFHLGHCCYRRSFTLPALVAGRRYAVSFSLTCPPNAPPQVKRRPERIRRMHTNYRRRHR